MRTHTIAIFIITLVPSIVVAQTQSAQKPAASSASVAPTAIKRSMQTPIPDSNPQLWTPKPVKDPKAEQVVQAALAALGGSAAIAHVQNNIVQATFVNTGTDPTQPIRGSITWTTSGIELRVDFSTEEGQVERATGHSQPFQVLSGKSKSPCLRRKH
jgi:hypothetical protein